MRQRQEGADIVKMYELAENAEESIRDVVVELVTMAYEQPRYSGEDYKQQAVSEFKAQMMVKCMRAGQ
jgi:hypothetical protein